MAVNRGHSKRIRKQELRAMNLNVTDGYSEYRTLNISQMKK